MTSKITIEAQSPSDDAERDLGALTDQWVDQNWYLPPGGDQSWREQEARQRFSRPGEQPINNEEDSPPLASVDQAVGDLEGAYQPGFRRAGALSLVLPISVAACVMLFAASFLVPQILRSDLWGPVEPQALSGTPLRVANEAEEILTPNLAQSDDAQRDADKVVSQARLQQQAVAPIYRNTVLPRLRLQMPITATDDQQSRAPAARIVKALSSKKPAAKSLPPIGAAYFASHAPAPAAEKQIAVSSHPIGQAYFESHAPAAD